MARDIKDVLIFRDDISQFLVHMTRDKKDRAIITMPAAAVLRKIIRDRELIASEIAMSDSRFFIYSPQQRKDYCRAISFTETPLNEIHSFLKIIGRSCDFQPYGLVFIKKKLREKGVSPVFYINNEKYDKLEVVEALCQLRNFTPEHAKQILPLLSTFGKQLRRDEKINFLWEREWRYPGINGNLEFDEDDVFVGICPHDDISRFQSLFPVVPFVDCQRNMKWYAKKLISARQHHDLKSPVV